MRGRTFDLGPNPRLVFSGCRGDLRIERWDLEQVQLVFRRESDASNVQPTADGLAVSGVMPEVVNFPAGATARLERCQGDVGALDLAALEVEQHQGDLLLERVIQADLATVHGDVEARDGRSLRVYACHGDLQVRNLEEQLSIERVHGDMVLRRTCGQMALQEITGDVVIRDPSGHLQVSNVTGDIDLTGDLQSGDYSLEAWGDIMLCLVPTSNICLELQAPRGRIRSDLALGETQESELSLCGKLGQGTTHVRAVAHDGDIRVRPLGADQLRHELERERIWDEKHAREVAERAQKLADKARKASERLARRAEEREAESRRWETRLDVPRGEPFPDTLKDERLSILKMLADDKISAEQAENLLAALEG